MSMTKQDLLSTLAKQSNVTVKQADAVLTALIGVVHDAVKSKSELQITGLGKFSVTERAARIGRNPQTGDEVQIAARVSPKFTAGKALKEAANV